MNEKYEELKSRLAAIHDVHMARSILSWDQHTKMPPKAGDARAEHLGTLDLIAHEMFVDDEIGALLEELRPYEESLDYDSDEGSLVRITRREYEKAKRVPPELRAELTRAGAVALAAWIESRQKSDFSIFLPYLQKNVELVREYVACFPKHESDYDVLLDDYDEGMTTAEVRAVFDELKAELIPLIAEIGERAEAVDNSCLSGHFPLERQRAFALEVLEQLGYDPESWRLDPTVHPFAMSAATTDIRLTTRYDESDLGSLTAAIHEFGHGFYEAGIDPALERTLLSQVSSMSLHESQSRMWENLIGRSLPFWRHFYPRLQETYPEQFSDVELDEFYRAVNKVEPSLIRIEADEATYNLHIILRFELEQEILDGSLDLADLPEAWNARMTEYLGVDVPDDAHGVLQDVHWSGGAIGYFPTYSLGNVISVQLWEQIRAALPDLDQQLERGEFGELAGWLRENLHRHGRKFTSKETLERIVGGPIDAGPYLRYLKDKLGGIYGIRVETGARAPA
jgi:carboxypeptidase Taq